MEKTKKSRVRLGKSKDKRALTDRPEVTFAGSISNMAGGFDLFEMGSVRMIQRNIPREEFLQNYCSDISSVFGLTNAQELLLKVMLPKKRFFDLFSWNDELKVELSKETGISVNHVEHCFRAFVSRKKLFRMVKRSIYKFNSDYVFHPSEVSSADFLGVNIRYIFDPETDAEVVLQKDKKNITLSDINTMIEIYNRQQKREGQIKGMFEE